MTTKGGQILKIFLSMSGKLNGQFLFIVLWESIYKAHSMVKGIGSEFHIKVCSSEQCLDGVGKCLMSLFHWTVLLQVICASREYVVSLFVEMIANIWVIIELPSLVHIDIIVTAWWVILSTRKCASHCIGAALEMCVSPCFMPVK